MDRKPLQREGEKAKRAMHQAREVHSRPGLSVDAGMMLAKVEMIDFTSGYFFVAW